MAFVFWSTYQGNASDRRPFGNKGYVSLYTISYRMCSNAGLYDHSKALYDRTKDEIEHVLQHYVVPELNKISMQMKQCHTQQILTSLGES